jgi:bile acid:Na+ symporter, BASS family
MKDLFFPIGLGILMLSLGLSLTVTDFKRAWLYPRAVLIALVCQTLIMPLICFFIAKGFGLGPEFAVGLMLLAATPGGATANLYSHLAGGDVALNITLTAVNSLLSLLTLPLILGFSLHYFLHESKSIPLQTGKIIQVLLIVVLPVLVGMYARHLKPDLAKTMERPVKIMAMLFLIIISALVIYGQWQKLLEYFPLVGASVTLFNILSLVTGYAIALWVKLERRQAIAIGMEVGIHNGALAIGLALSPQILNNPTMAIPPTLYGILSLFIAAAFAAVVHVKHK